MKVSSAVAFSAATVLSIGLGLMAVAAPWLCAWLVLAGMFAAAWVTSWVTSRDVFAPLLPVAGYLFLGIGIRGLALREGWLPNPYNVPLSNDWLMASVFLLGALATASCILGYRSRAGLSLGRRWGSARWLNVTFPRHAVMAFAIVAATIGLLSLYLLRRRFAGVPGFGVTPAVIASQTSKGGLFTIDMLAFFPLVGFLITWRDKRLGVTGHVISAVNLCLVLTWFVVEGRKALLFELIFALLILRHYLRRPIRGRVLALALLPALVLISLAFYFKSYGFQTQSIASQYSQQPAWEAVVDPLLTRSYQFDAASMIVSKTTSVNDYRAGSTLEELLWFYIPRQWWAGKPLSFGFTFGPEFFPRASQTASYTPSLVGELYLNFGVLGVAGGFYLFGVALRACYVALTRKRTPLTVAAYALVLFQLTNMVEGPIAGQIEFLLSELLPLALFIAWNGRGALRTAAPLRPAHTPDLHPGLVPAGGQAGER